MAIIGYTENTDLTSFNESTLSKSETFKLFQAIGDPIEKAKNLIKNARVLTNEDIETAYIQVKQYSNSLSRSAVKAYDTGSVVLLYTELPSLRMSQAFPFITFRHKDKYITYIFIDKYISKRKDGGLDLSPAVLHDLLIGGVIANKLKTNYDSLASNQYLQKMLMEIYTKFVTRIINKEYGIGADKQISDSAQYFINRFFLEKIFETNDVPENIERLSINKLKYLDEMLINEIKIKYETANPSSFSELLELVKSLSVRMNSLTLKLFTDKWINYYYAPATLAIDNMEYLIFMIIALLHGNNTIISIKASEIVKETKGIKMLQEEMLKLIN
jgi:hypothetical protein